MIIHTLSSDAAVSLELGHRIARTELRRRARRRTPWGTVKAFLFPRVAGKLVRARA